jgi:low molecular weight protein-tyrosine phosphatase
LPHRKPPVGGAAHKPPALQVVIEISMKQQNTIRILFVCMGNICRSPAAQAVFEHKLTERGLAERFQVDSSGTIAYHVGEAADSRMRDELSRHGIVSRSRSQQFLESDFERYDLILAMDRSNYSSLKRMIGASGVRPELADRLRMFRDFDPEGRGDVPDPYYGGSRGFALVYEMVERTAENLLKYLLSQELSV